jgi:hypothetical protein
MASEQMLSTPTIRQLQAMQRLTRCTLPWRGSNLPPGILNRRPSEGYGSRNFLTKFAKWHVRCNSRSERTRSAQPIRMLRFVHRAFCPCQSRMSIDPSDSILLGSKFPEMAHGPIRPYYLDAPASWVARPTNTRADRTFGGFREIVSTRMGSSVPSHSSTTNTASSSAGFVLLALARRCGLCTR